MKELVIAYLKSRIAELEEAIYTDNDSRIAELETLLEKLNKLTL